MKHMFTGHRIGKRNVAPKFYIRDMNTGLSEGRAGNLETMIKKADKLGLNAHVFKMGTCTNPVHIGTYE